MKTMMHISKHFNNKKQLASNYLSQSIQMMIESIPLITANHPAQFKYPFKTFKINPILSIHHL